MIKNMKSKQIPLEIENYIYFIANNKCHTCQVICKIPNKKLGKYYYCVKNAFIIIKKLIL